MGTIEHNERPSYVALVTGAGGFIGGHLSKMLNEKMRIPVVLADIKPSLDTWWQVPENTTHLCYGYDLKNPITCHNVVGQAISLSMQYGDVPIRIFNLACNMGGMGFIELNKLECMLSSLITTNMLVAAADCSARNGPDADRIDVFVQTSSACAYAAQHQTTHDRGEMIPLAEHMAYPADPEDGYGWEKLFGERMCRHFMEDRGLKTRVVRIHNCYGPHGSWRNGREKAPAAICRKIAYSKLIQQNFIDVWGNGKQMRSYTYIDDIILGLFKIAESTIYYPINLGSNETVNVNQLINRVEKIAEWHVQRQYDVTKPQGVRGRTSDNTRILSELGWEPTTTLQYGLEKTYEWIEREVKKATSQT